VVFLLDFFQLVDGTGAITVTLCPLDEFIIKMCLQPLMAAFTPAHFCKPIISQRAIVRIITPLFTE